MTTILYIEDDPGSQILVQRMLSFAGYRVVVASRGLEGIDMAIKTSPDLILMDVNLPDLSGREVTTRLRGDERFKQTPIVALTAQLRSGEREKAMASGMTGYLTKPVDIEKLPSDIERFLKGARDQVSPEALTQATQEYNQEIVARLEVKIRELESNNAELRRLDKVKDDFIQLTAHELRTPLTVVIAYMRLLQDSAVMRHVQQEFRDVGDSFSHLVSAIERMNRVVNEIIIVSRVASGRIELSIGPVNLADVAESVVHEVREAAKTRQLTILFDKQTFPTDLYADSELLRLALSNVLTNAVKYTPDGGRVWLSARTQDSNALITVQDTGIGIAKEDQESIFGRFHTANDTRVHTTSKIAFQGGGLGLGLSICRSIIEAHGGRIWAESKGRDEEALPGSTFYVDLPLQARAAVKRV